MFQLSKNQDRLSEIREFQELAQTLKPIFDSVDESIQKIASYILNIKFPSYTVDEIKLNANKESLVRVTDQQALIEESYKVSTRNSSSEELNSLMFMVFTACNLQTIYSINN